ncbi:MAG: SIMPL domain-containing protein [Thaumarchaeota archaeon]|nr:SIMPL domain-containing protein [Nitrososphaerota archaeon]
MTTRTKIILATIAAIVIVSATVIVSMQNSSNQAYAQQVMYYSPPQENTISVTGSATASISPDLVSLQLGVDTQATTAHDAMTQNAQAMNATATAIQSLGITQNEISTAGFTIDPVYNQTGPYPPYNSYKNELVGYKVSNTLLIKTTKLDLAGSILDTAVGAGANRVDSVSFSLSPAKQKSIQDNLLNNAILNSQSRAEKALDPLGQKIIGVKSVDLSEFTMPPPLPVYSGMAMAEPMVKTPVFASNQDVTTTVNVIFLIGVQ